MAKIMSITDELLVRTRIEAFMADYVHAIDTDRLEEWPNYFTEDAVYQVRTRENHECGLPLNVMSCSGSGMFRDRIGRAQTLRANHRLGLPPDRHVAGHSAVSALMRGRFSS